MLAERNLSPSPGRRFFSRPSFYCRGFNLHVCLHLVVIDVGSHVGNDLGPRRDVLRLLNLFTVHPYCLLVFVWHLGALCMPLRTLGDAVCTPCPETTSTSKALRAIQYL